MDNTLRSYIAEAIFSNVTQDIVHEEDEEEPKEDGNNTTKEPSKRLSSYGSFKSIAYIDDDIETETLVKSGEQEQNEKQEDKHINDNDDEVFQSDPFFPTDSTSDSEESFRTAPNTLSRDEGMNCSALIAGEKSIKEKKLNTKKRRIFASVGDIMTTMSPGFTRKLSLRRLRGREQKFSDPLPTNNGSKWSFLSRSHSTKDFSKGKHDFSEANKYYNKEMVKESDMPCSSDSSSKPSSSESRKTSFSTNTLFRKHALKRTFTTSSVNSVISNFNRSLSFRSKPKRRSQSCRSLGPKKETAKFYNEKQTANLANHNTIQRRYQL